MSEYSLFPGRNVHNITKYYSVALLKGLKGFSIKLKSNRVRSLNTLQVFKLATKKWVRENIVVIRRFPHLFL